MRDKKLLIVDDDASWLQCVPTYLFKNHKIVTNLRAGLKEIDGRKRWDAAIFDLYLMEGKLPYGKGRLSKEAGYILALAFLNTFPGKRVAICSGYSHQEDQRIQKLFDPEICRFFQKQKYMNRHAGRIGFENVKLWTGNADDIANFLLGESTKRFSSAWLDSLMLEPNFCGIGIDLKKLLDTILRPNKS